MFVVVFPQAGCSFNAEELETIPAGANARTSHHQSPAEEGGSQLIFTGATVKAKGSGVLVVLVQRLDVQSSVTTARLLSEKLRRTPIPDFFSLFFFQSEYAHFYLHKSRSQALG